MGGGDKNSQPATSHIPYRSWNGILADPTPLHNSPFGATLALRVLSSNKVGDCLPAMTISLTGMV